MVDLGIVGGCKFGRDRNISQESTYNMFVTDGALVSFPGYKQLVQFDGVSMRGVAESIKDDILVFVIDDGVYVMDASLSATKVGDLESNEGPVYIHSNNASPTQFCISDLRDIYVYTVGSGVNKVTPPVSDFVAGYMEYQDGYFICPNRNTNKWYLSKLNDGSSWVDVDAATGLSYEGAFGTKPDTLVACVAFNRQLFVMSKNATEIWRDVGNTIFPYQRDNSLSIDYGCISIDSIASGFGVAVWLGKNEYTNPVIVYSTGGKPQAIESDGIDYLIDQLEYPESSSGFLYKDGSHTFYQITFDRDNITITYDFSTGMFFRNTDENGNHHIARKFLEFNNSTYLIPFADQSNVAQDLVYLYEYNQKYTTYDGKTIPQIRITPPLRKPDTTRFSIPQVAIRIKQGRSKQKQRAFIAMSHNGGISFSGYAPMQMNTFGYGDNRMVFRQLGSGNDITFKFLFQGGVDSDEKVENGELHEDMTITGGEVDIR